MTMTAYTNSFLARMIAKIRRLTDEPIINKKYTDAHLIEMIQDRFLYSITENNQTTDNPIVVQYSFTPSSSVSTYVLPPTCGRIYGIYTKSGDDEGQKIYYAEYAPTSSLPRLFSIENNTLIFNLTEYPHLFDGVTYVFVDYIPNGCAKLFETDSSTHSATSVTCGYTTYLGTVDRRPNAYLGSTLRLLSDTNNYAQQDRRITAVTQGASSLVFTVTPAFSPVPYAATPAVASRFEIVPPFPEGFDIVISSGVAAEICSLEGNGDRAAALFKMAYDQMCHLRVVEGGKRAWRSHTPHRNNHRTSRVTRTFRRRY